MKSNTKTSLMGSATTMRILMALCALALWVPILYFQVMQAEKQQTTQLHQTTRALLPSVNLALSEGQIKPVKQALEELAIDSKKSNFRVAIYNAAGEAVLSSFNEGAPAADSIPKDTPKWTAEHNGLLAHRVPVHGTAFMYATQKPVDPKSIALSMAPVIAGSVLLTGLFAGFFVNSLERKSNRSVYNTVDELDDRLKVSGRPPILSPGRGGVSNELRTRINKLLRRLGDAEEEANSLADRLNALKAEQKLKVEKANETRDHTEKLLHKSERQYARLVETSNGLIWAIDKKGNWSFLNKNATQIIYGQPTEKLLGQPFMTCSTAESLDKDEDMVRALLSGRSFFTYETVHKQANGSEINLTFNAVPLFDEHGHIAGATGTATDVTARSLAENREEELKGRLVRAERMESLGLLAGGVAHDLNNILGPVIGYPDLILEAIPPDNPAVSDLMEIKRSAKRASAVIQDLLTLSRRGGYHTMAVYMHDVVDDYLNSASFKDLGMRFPDIELDRFFTENRKPLEGSIPHLNQVIMNLVTNAYEAIETKGKVEIRVDNEFLQEDRVGYETIQPGHYVVFRVKDSGPGITPEVLQKIFEPFFSSKKMGRSGTGLGLAVVYGVVKDLKGFLDVKTEPGHGTEFSLYFPLTTEEPEVTPEEFRDFSGTETLLVIDDVPEQRLLAKRLLSSVGYTVMTAEHGRAGVEMVARSGRAIDLIIIDMVMEEGFDGLDTYLGIREQFPGMPCVIISGFSESDRVKDALRHGVHQYLKKPYTLDSIAAIIREILDNQPEPQPTPVPGQKPSYNPPTMVSGRSPKDTWTVPLTDTHGAGFGEESSDSTQPIFLADFEEDEVEVQVELDDDDLERTQAIALPDFDDDGDSEHTQQIILPDDL